MTECPFIVAGGRVCAQMGERISLTAQAFYLPLSLSLFPIL